MNNLKIKIFSDGANIEEMKQMNSNQLISGLTTNPTLMRKSGITNYLEFVENVLDFVNEKPISFEVFSDDFDEMYHQAHKINEYNKNGNIYIKIPVSNTKGEFSGDLIKKLSSEGLSLNVTAVFTEKQVHSIVKLLNKNTKNFISIFCGRIADTGVDPEKLIMNVVTTYKSMNFFEFLWASPREVFNIIQAERSGCHIITCTSDILNKLKFLNYSLEEYSIDTVKMFYDDAAASGFKI